MFAFLSHNMQIVPRSSITMECEDLNQETEGFILYYDDIIVEFKFHK